MHVTWKMSDGHTVLVNRSESLPYIKS